MRSSLLRALSVALAALFVVGLAVPASADSISSARRKRDELRAKRAAAARELNVLKASDNELEKALGALNTQVRAQEAKVSSARQAVAAAEAALGDAQRRLAATRTEIERLHGLVVDRAVSAYMRPHDDALAGFAQARDVTDASRRRALLEQVAANDRELIDQLGAAREDLEIEEARLVEVRAVADERKRAVEQQLGALKSARAEKARLAAALDVRIREFQSEVDGLAAQEAQVADLIRKREAAAAAARASRSAVGVVGDGGRVSGAGLIWPVRGRVTSEYGYRWGRMHAGIDIGAPTGTPIVAAKAGEVIYAGTMSGYGNVVIVDHGGGFSTLYAHQSRIATTEGRALDRGQVLGYVGSTGRSTGPHLHFETRVNGSAQNPRRYLP